MTWLDVTMIEMVYVFLLLMGELAVMAGGALGDMGYSGRDLQRLRRSCCPLAIIIMILHFIVPVAWILTVIALVPPFVILIFRLLFSLIAMACLWENDNDVPIAALYAFVPWMINGAIGLVICIIAYPLGLLKPPPKPGVKDSVGAWIRVAPLIAGLRANKGSPLSGSMIQLLPDIARFVGPTRPLSDEEKKKNKSKRALGNGNGNDGDDHELSEQSSSSSGGAGVVPSSAPRSRMSSNGSIASIVRPDGASNHVDLERILLAHGPNDTSLPPSSSPQRLADHRIGMVGGEGWVVARNRGLSNDDNKMNNNNNTHHHTHIQIDPSHRNDEEVSDKKVASHSASGGGSGGTTISVKPKAESATDRHALVAMYATQLKHLMTSTLLASLIVDLPLRSPIPSIAHRCWHSFVSCINCTDVTLPCMDCYPSCYAASTFGTPPETEPEKKKNSRQRPTYH
jgi:hypothetical protein